MLAIASLEQGAVDKNAIYFLFVQGNLLFHLQITRLDPVQSILGT